MLVVRRNAAGCGDEPDVLRVLDSGGAGLLLRRDAGLQPLGVRDGAEHAGNNIFGPYDFNDTVVAIAIDPDLGDGRPDRVPAGADEHDGVVDSDFTSRTSSSSRLGGISYLKTPEDPETGEEVGLRTSRCSRTAARAPTPLRARSGTRG